MKQTIKLTESDLHRIVKESVNKILNENQGFMDGAKGAWNGFKGSRKMGGLGGAVKGAVKGFQQGQQGQQQVLNNRRLEGLDSHLSSMRNCIQHAMKAYQSGNIDNLEDYVEWVQSYAKDILSDLRAQANQGIDYSADADFSN